MKNVEVLDCTLRDGGYINEWNFGKENSIKICKNINESNIEYVEVGFLNNVDYKRDSTLFNNPEQIKEIVQENKNFKIAAMIIFGKYDINQLPKKTKNVKLDAIRVTFKKNEIKEVEPALKKIKKLGYDLFVNPTNVDTYTKSELLELVKFANKINPYAFTIVDTKGVLKEKDLKKIYKLVDENLKPHIGLGFHSHNNLQLSFSNAQCLIKICKKRKLIIDSTIFGMGRGAGNLCTELLVQYLNDNYGGKYELLPILKSIDEQINPIFIKTPWGYSVPYYLAAVNHCHPSYAKYLVDKQTVPVEVINSILTTIPNENKGTYNEEYIKQLYLDSVTTSTDDSEVVKKITKLLSNRKILVLAPGKTLKTEQNKINEFIKTYDPYIISLNFEPKIYNSSMVFVTNAKRFLKLQKPLKSVLVATSNIKTTMENILKLNYSSYLNSSKMFDNTALMLVNLLTKIGIKEINFAGLDGFKMTTSENYALDEFYSNLKLNELNENNEIIKKELENASKNIKINFLTKSLYQF